MNLMKLLKRIGLVNIDNSVGNAFSLFGYAKAGAINSKTFTIEGNHRSISAVNGKLYVDGELYKGEDNSEKYEVVKVVVNGNVDNLDAATVEVNGNVTGDVDGTTIRVTGNVGGSVDGTTVTVGGDVKGDIDAVTVRGY